MAVKHVVLFAVIVFLTIESLAALSIISKRSLESSAAANTSGEAQLKVICQGRTPCGWAVYDRINRYIEYFMRNTCECSNDTKCLRDDDDISITAFVYRCKAESTS